MSKLKEWWSTISVAIDVIAGIFITFAMLICMFKKEWVEGIYWGVFLCTLKLHDIKETLNDRL